MNKLSANLKKQKVKLSGPVSDTAANCRQPLTSSLVLTQVIISTLPNLNDILDEMVNAAIDENPHALDDDAEEAEDDLEEAEESSDDESYDVVAADEDPLYELGGAVNAQLNDSVDTV